MNELQLRTKATEIIERLGNIGNRQDIRDMKAKQIDDITEALVDTYKQGAMSRVTGPEKLPTAHLPVGDQLHWCTGYNACIDEIKITPLSAEDILPSNKNIWEYAEKSSKETRHKTDSILVQKTIEKACFWLRDFVHAKLEGTK